MWKEIDNEMYCFMAKKVGVLSQDTSYAKAARAKLRRAAGKSVSDTPEIWDITLYEMPESLLQNEAAIVAAQTALTLFALHGQNAKGVSLGKAMKRLAPPGNDDVKSLKRRFDAVVTSYDQVELANHLRGLVKLFKSKDIPLDFVRLAGDIFFFSLGGESKNKVRLRWARDYYYFKSDNNLNAEEQENE